MIGGDDLDENFVLDSESSGSEADSIDVPSRDCSDSKERNILPEDEGAEEPTKKSQPEAKKVKLNWREASSRSTGSPEDQLETMRVSRIAFEKFFPSVDVPICGDGLSVDRFVDLSEYCACESKNTQALFATLRDQGFLASPIGESPSGIRTLIVTSSATRGMFLIKELKEFDKSLSPLPLFFHGGGRKKEQSNTHESVIRGNKSSVAVCLPSRLRVVAETGVLNFENIDLVIFDLKPNEKRLNVLSMKDTMADCLTIIGQYILGGRRNTLLGRI